MPRPDSVVVLAGASDDQRVVVVDRGNTPTSSSTVSVILGDINKHGRVGVAASLGERRCRRPWWPSVTSGGGTRRAGCGCRQRRAPSASSTPPPQSRRWRMRRSQSRRRARGTIGDGVHGRSGKLEPVLTPPTFDLTDEDGSMRARHTLGTVSTPVITRPRPPAGRPWSATGAPGWSRSSARSVGHPHVDERLSRRDRRDVQYDRETFPSVPGFEVPPQLWSCSGGGWWRD